MGGKKLSVGHKKSSEGAPPLLPQASPPPEEPAGDVPYLPMELWTGILIRTPAEDLLKFKRVCKAWYELIRTQSFAESHVDHWSSQTIGRLVFNFQLFRSLGCECWKNGISYLVYAKYGSRTRSQDDEHDNGCHCRYRELLTSRQREELGCGCKELQVLASCDGLILICYEVEKYHYQLLISNPLTGSYKKLPVLGVGTARRVLCIHYGWSRWTMLRTASGRYKIFGISMYGYHSSAGRECYIFELQMDTKEQPDERRWKEVMVPLSREWYVKVSTIKDGKVHWFATTQQPRANHEHDFDMKVLSLDILKEEFSPSVSVSVQSKLCGPEWCFFSWKGAFYHPVVHWQDKSCSLWVLEDFDTMTWTEYGNFHYRYDPDFLCLSPTVVGDNKLLLGSYGSFILYVFDLISKEFGRLIMDFRCTPGRIKVLHTDSLIGCN